MTKPGTQGPRRAGREKTMKLRAPSDSWIRFLEAERTGREDEAELALLAVFTELPRLSPAAGFADRVLFRLGSAAARRSLFARRPVRWALAASLLIAGLGAGLVAPMVPQLAALVGPGELLAALVATVSDLAVRFASGVAVWQQVAETVGTLARATANPKVAALLLFHLILAAGALRGLTALASKEGSSGHVAG